MKLREKVTGRFRHFVCIRAGVSLKRLWHFGDLSFNYPFFFLKHRKGRPRDKTNREGVVVNSGISISVFLLSALVVATKYTCGYGDKTSFSVECVGMRPTKIYIWCKHLSEDAHNSQLAAAERTRGKVSREAAEPKAHCAPATVNLHSKREYRKKKNTGIIAFWIKRSRLYNWGKFYPGDKFALLLLVFSLPALPIFPSFIFLFFFGLSFSFCQIKPCAKYNSASLEAPRCGSVFGLRNETCDIAVNSTYIYKRFIFTSFLLQ